jgi:hypothetical protein
MKPPRNAHQELNVEKRRNQFEAPSQAHYSSFAAASALDIGHGVFASLALSYWAQGFSPIPILAGTKAPGVDGRLMDGWAQYCAEAADKAQLAAWAQDKTAGLAVCTGFNGLVAVDVDSAKAVAAVRAVFGGMGAPVKIGRRGCTALFRDPSGEVRSSDFRAAPVIGPDGKRRQETLVQILAAGRETVLPPTVHPDTRKPYFWHRSSLEACRLGDLPVIKANHIDALHEALRPFLSETVQFMPAAPAQAPLRNLNGLERRRYEAMARGLLKWVEGALANRAPGGRSRAARGIAQTFWPFIREGLIGEAEVRAAIVDASQRNGLVKTNGIRDVLRDIRRGFEAGAADPLPTLENRTSKRA